MLEPKTTKLIQHCDGSIEESLSANRIQETTIESIHFVESIKFRLYFKNEQQEMIQRALCRIFYNEVYLTEPNKPIHFYDQSNGDRVSIIKSTDHCYSVRYRERKEL